MDIKADINKVTVQNWHILSGEYNSRNIEVQLSNELLDCEGCIVTFELSNGTIIEFPVDEGQIEVLWFIEPQQITVGVYTYDTDESGNLIKRYSPEPCKAWIRQGSFGGANNPLLSPGRYAELLKEINNIPNPDYEQNDPIQKDYIKNRPFYTEQVEVDYLTLPYVETEKEFAIIDKIGLEAGKDYTVDIYDNSGNVESITVQSIDMSSEVDFSVVALMDESEAFFAIFDGASLDENGDAIEDNTAVYYVHSDYSKILIHGIASVQTTIHTLPTEYLPSISTNLIENGAVTQKKLAENAVDSVNVVNSAITTDKLNNKAVTTDKLNDASVTSDKLADQAITTAKIKDLAVNSSKLADNAVTEEKLAGGSVTNDKLSGNISRFKLTAPKHLVTKSISSTDGSEDVATFSYAASDLNKQGQKFVIYGTIVSSDTESTEQTLLIRGYIGLTPTTLVSATADFSNSKKWNVSCTIDQYKTGVTKTDLLLTSDDGEKIHEVSHYVTHTFGISGVSVQFGDVDTQLMTNGTYLSFNAYE